MDKTFILWFGSQVRKRRIERGLSQEKLAELASLNRTYVGAIERGERNISLKNIKRIADTLGIKVRDLFEEE